MCGLFGWFDSQRQICPGQKRMLAYMSHTRGTHGVGMVGFTDHGPLAWKTEKSILDVLKDIPVEKDPFFRYHSLLGHNRRASSSLGDGSTVNLENAHPFTVGNITLAHNGIVSNWKDIAKELEAIPKYKDIAERAVVDSHILCAAVDAWGAAAFKKVYGKAAVWFTDDRDKNSAYMWVWDQDLAFAQFDGASCFASELNTLEASGFKYAAIKLQDEGQLLKFDIAKSTTKRLASVEGVVKEFATPSTSYTQWDFHVPADIGDLKEEFQVLQGQAAGYCPACNEVVTHWQVGLMMDNKVSKMFHNSSQCKSKSYIVPMTAKRCSEFIARRLLNSPKADFEKLRSYWSGSSPKRQITWNEIDKAMNKIEAVEKEAVSPYCDYFFFDEKTVLGLYKSVSDLQFPLRKLEKKSIKQKYTARDYDPGLDKLDLESYIPPEQDELDKDDPRLWHGS